MEPRRVTIRDVAAQAGVSVATVSKVINGRYGVAAATNARVQEVIEQLGYEASLVAQSLRNHRTNVIGVLVADIEPFSAELLKGAAEAIRSSGFELVVYSAGGLARDKQGWEGRYLSRLSGTLIDGAVLVTPTVVEARYGSPIVAVDPHTGRTDLPTIDSDNLHGGRIATEHLLALGHRRIGLLAGRPDLESARLREDGYRAALAAAGIDVDPALIMPGDFRPDPSREAARRLLALPDRPTGVFAANDWSAIALMEVARDLRLRVPEDVSVIGFDNIPESALTDPALTTVDQPIQEMGRLAVELLVRLIDGEEDAGPMRQTLPTTLVVRQSTRRVGPPVRARRVSGPMSAESHEGRGPVIWRDTAAGVDERVADLMARMTLREKVAQLYGVWVGADDSAAGVAPHQHELAAAPVDWDGLIASGIGQLTRPFGTAPVDPAIGARSVARTQRQIMAAGRFGVPALVHEECLTGLAAWQATVYPAPLSWGASFDPALVEEMGRRIGTTMRALGIHQGLAPVLDVVRDLRWGRVEETIGEDPLLVGTIGSAYVRGLEAAGVVSTLKHFVGYSASRAGRNHAPVSIGPRELADVLLPPFEQALRAGARSVMNSYVDMDGVPAAADPTLLTDLLRDRLGFTGTVVADYFAVSFLRLTHAVAADDGEAAGLALAAGIDVELPTVNCFGDPLLEALDRGDVDEALVDRAVTRVLRQKCELGLLDAGWSPEPPALEGPFDIDDAEGRALARRLAERSVVLLANDGTLPLSPGLRVAVVGPRADEPGAMLGCYSFPLHVGAHHPEVPMGVSVPTLLEALRAEGVDATFAEGVPVLGGDDAGIAEAARVAADADVCVAVLGDLAGLFGGGTSGEGCDVADLRLPGRQEELLEALLATGTPVVAVLLVGRPHDLWRQADRLAAVVAGFFPGEEGGPALAGVLTGRVNPSGRLPVSFPGAGTSQPATYLAAPLAARTDVSTVDPTPLFPFGHGLSYTPVTWVDAGSDGPAEWATDGVREVFATLRNLGQRDGTEVVQVYLHDVAAEVVRPVRQLVAAARVDLAAGETRTVRFRLHADLTSFTGRAGRRIVEPGPVELLLATSSADVRVTVPLTLTGPRREVGFDRVLTAEILLEPAPDPAAGVAD